MIDREHALAISKQAEVLNIGRGSVYYQPRPVAERDLKLMLRIDGLHLEFPFARACCACCSTRKASPWAASTRAR